MCRALLAEDKETAARAIGIAAAAGNAAEPLSEAKMMNRGLNEGQRRAIGFALAAQPVALIHGPPGTGKKNRQKETTHKREGGGRHAAAT